MILVVLHDGSLALSDAPRQTLFLYQWVYEGGMWTINQPVLLALDIVGGMQGQATLPPQLSITLQVAKDRQQATWCLSTQGHIEACSLPNIVLHVTMAGDVRLSRRLNGHHHQQLWRLADDGMIESQLDPELTLEGTLGGGVRLAHRTPVHRGQTWSMVPC